MAIGPSNTNTECQNLVAADSCREYRILSIARIRSKPQSDPVSRQGSPRSPASHGACIKLQLPTG
eukprot:3988545-Amphidinium_carterae.1